MSAATDVALRASEATEAVSAIRTRVTSLVTLDSRVPVGCRWMKARESHCSFSHNDERRSRMMRWPTYSIR